jgi:hypothetical protein
MKRIRLWSLSAALAAGGTAAADPPTPPPPREQTTLMHKLFGPKPPKPVGPTVAGATAPQRPPTITAPLPPEVVRDSLRAEQDAYLRRLSVCTELRRVATEKGDEALLRQADELERQVTSLYHTRVAGLGVPRVKAALPDGGGTGLASLDPPASPAEKARRLEAPAAPVAGSTASAVREVPQ